MSTPIQNGDDDAYGPSDEAKKNELLIEKPSNRVLIKILQTNKIEVIYDIQNIQLEEDKDFFTIQFWLRSFLLLTNIFNGMVCGMTSTTGKICLITFGKCPGFTCLWNPVWLITFLSSFCTVFSNLFNLNTTISLYSQLITMPIYECCLIFGLLAAGGVVMGEFGYYTWT